MTPYSMRYLESIPGWQHEWIPDEVMSDMIDNYDYRLFNYLHLFVYGKRKTLRKLFSFQKLEVGETRNETI